MSKRKTKKQISFEIVLEKYSLGDYTNASILLKKAKIKSDEAGHAKQLRIALNLQLAFQYFEKHLYESAIKHSLANREMQAKEGFPFSFEKHDVLAGISHLYLGNFSEAEKYLSHTLENENTKGFYFYYMLAHLFRGDYVKTKTIAQFKKELPETVNNLSENKQLFLQAMFYLQKDNKAGAIKTLQDIKAVSHSQKVNLNAMVSFLTNKKITQSSSLQPLYKVLFNFNLDENERNYLSKFPILQKNTEPVVKISSVSQIKTAIKALCEIGKPMSETIFAASLKQLDSAELENRKYLIFNQFTALIHKNKNRNTKKIEEILKNEYQDLFQVPESFQSYMLYIHENERIKGRDFYKFVSYYLEQNAEYLSEFEKHKVSMKIIGNLLKQQDFNNPETAFTKISSLNKKYNLIGFDLYLTCISIVSEFDLPENFKRLAQNEYYNQFSSDINIILKGVMASIEPSAEDFYEDELSFFNFMNGKSEVSTSQMKAFVKAHLLPLMNVLISNLSLSRKSKDILKIYLLINTYLKREEILKHIPKKKLKLYVDSYQERIKLFREDKANSSYQRDILELQTAMNAEKFTKIIKEKNDTTFIKLVDESLKEDKIDSVLNVLRKVLNDTEMPLNFFSKVFYLFSELHKKYNKKEFSQKVKIVKADYYDVINIIGFALKNYKKGKDEIFVYDLAEILIPAVYEEREEYRFNETYNKIVETKSYNLVIDFLAFVKKAEKGNLNFTYSLDLIEELLENLEKVIAKKVIKKVQTAYDSAIKHFKIKKEIDKVKINQFINTRNYKALEEYYFKEHIEKNTAKLFQDYIFAEIIVYYYSSDFKNRMIFIFVKAYIDNYPEKTVKELLDIIAPYVEERYYKDIAKFVAKAYPQYALFYYPIYENYIKKFLVGKANLRDAKTIINFLAAAAKAKDSGFVDFDNKIIAKAIKYIKPFMSSRSMSNKMKEDYRTAAIAFDKNLKQNKLF